MPSFLEQKAIASTLSCLDDKIELNNSMNKKLEEMTQTIFKSWFVDFEPFQDGEFEDSELGMIPKGWKVAELGNIATFIKGKKPINLEKSSIEGELKPYLTIDVLKGGSPEYAKTEKMILANEFDILMVMDGASSGTVYYGLEGVVGSTIAKYKVKEKGLLEIVYQYLHFNLEEIKSHNTGSAIPHADKGFISKCKIVVPEDNLNMKINKIFKDFRTLILYKRIQNNKLANLRDSLLPKLMSGEIRVPIEEVE